MSALWLCFITIGTAAAEPPPVTWDGLLTRARSDNPLVEIATQELAQIKARGLPARETWWGEGSLTTTIGAVPVCDDVEEVGGVQTCRDDLEHDLFLPERYRPHLRGSISYGWPVYTFGKRSAGLAAADAGVAAGNAGVKVAKGDAARLAKEAYWGSLLAREVVAIANEGLEKVEKERDRVIARLKKRDRSVHKRDKYRLIMKHAEVFALHAASLSAQERADAGIRLAAGQPPDAPFRLVGALVRADGAMEKKEGREVFVPKLLDRLPELRARAIADNPSVRALEKKVAAERALASMAEAAFWPDLILGMHATYRATVAEVDCLPDLVNRTAQCEGANFLPVPGAGLVLRWNVDVAARRSSVRQAEARAAQTAAELEVRKARVGFAVEKAWRELVRAQKVLGVQKQALSAARSLLVYEERRLKKEPGGTQKAAVGLYTLKIQRLRTLHDLNVAVARLSQLVGEDLEKHAENPPAPAPSNGTEGG